MIVVRIKNVGRIEKKWDMTFESDVITPQIYELVKANKRVCEITDCDNFRYHNRATFLQHYKWIETDPNNIGQHENPRLYFGSHPDVSEGEADYMETVRETMETRADILAEKQEDIKKITVIKGEKAILSLDQYLGLQGLSSPVSSYMDDKWRLPHGLTQRQRKQLEKDAEKAARDYSNQRQIAIKQYYKEVTAGRIKTPTRTELLVRTAQGNPDNQRVQAARRVLGKRGIDWETGEPINSVDSIKTEGGINMSNNKLNKITVIKVEPGNAAYVKEIEDSLESLQREVGGDIEGVYPFEDRVGIICNGEHKLNGMEMNRCLRHPDTGKAYDIIYGPFLLAGLNKDDFGSLSKELQEKYLEKFEQPEMFVMTDKGVMVLPMPTEDFPMNQEFESGDVPAEDGAMDEGFEQGM